MSERIPISVATEKTIYGRPKHWQRQPDRYGYPVENPIVLRTRQGKLEIYDAVLPFGTVLERSDLLSVTLNTDTRQVSRIQLLSKESGQIVHGAVLYESIPGNPNPAIVEVVFRKQNEAAA